MAKLTDEGVALRERLAAWVRYYRHIYRHKFPDQGEFARFMGSDKVSMSTILSGKTYPGLDFIVRMHAAARVSIDQMVDTDPPAIPREPAGPT
jgi:transcriptional regulator with XRE-family HTH domain